MKNPKWKCAYPNSHKVKFGGKFLTQWDGYHLTLEQSTGGTISADKLKGYQEQSANLSYTADTFYHFNGWNSTGANIQNNQVPFTADTTAKANFVYDPIPPSGRTTFTHYNKTNTWMNSDLNINDGGPGIIQIDNPFIVYESYEGGTTALKRIDLPGPLCYYTLPAAYRIANIISGWHMPTKDDWDAYVGPYGSIPLKQQWYEVRTPQVLKYWPSGAGYYGTTQTWESNFNALPVGYMDAVNKMMNSGYYITSGGLPWPSIYNLVGGWWAGSAGSQYGRTSYVGLGDDNCFTRFGANSASYHLVRLVKD